MTKDFLKDFFNVDSVEFDKLVESAAKAVAKVCDEPVEKKDETNGDDEGSKTETYYSETKKEYVDGELVKKSEKEYVNGACTKYEEYDATHSLDNKKKKCVCDKSKCETSNGSDLKKENDDLKKQIEDMTRYIDKLNDKLNEVEKKNYELNATINNVKKCF